MPRSGALRSVDVLGQRLLGRLDERGEGRGLVHRELGEHATVDLHTREAEALDEAVVRDAVLAARSVDALDPQAAEVALALATVTVRVDERVGDLLLRLAVQARTLTPVTGGALED